MLAHQTLQGLNALALGGKCRISRHTLLHRKCIRRIELAIQIGMDWQRGIFIDQRTGHDSALPMVLITWFRPRARRDITVPVRTPAPSLISRYGGPSTSRTDILSPNALG